MEDQRPAFIGLTLFAVGIGIGAFSLSVPLASDALESSVASVVGFEIFLALAAFAGATRHPSPMRRLGLGPGRLGWGWIAVVAVGTVGLSHALDAALAWSGLRADSVLSHLDSQLAAADSRALWIALIGLGLVPAFCEELLCRGLLQRGIASRYGPRLAVLASAVVFGGLHLEWIQGSAAFVLGLYIGSVCQIAGSIRPAIVCHAANNLAAVLGGAFGPAAIGAFGLAGASPATAVTGLATAVVAITLVSRRHRQLRP